MKNHWLDERDVKVLVDYINTNLNKMYLGTQTNLDVWGPFVVDILKDYKQKVRDRILSSYFIEEKFDEQGRLQEIKLIMLPWSI